MEQESVVDGNLATESSLIVLDTLEIIVKVKLSIKLGKSNFFRHNYLFFLRKVLLLQCVVSLFSFRLWLHLN